LVLVIVVRVPDQQATQRWKVRTTSLLSARSSSEGFLKLTNAIVPQKKVSRWDSGASEIYTYCRTGRECHGVVVMHIEVETLIVIVIEA
jgi:hypothetical protein